ncbi:MAG: heme-binding protein [Acidobacteriaceae bacterium]
MKLLRRTACLAGLAAMVVTASQAQLADKKALTLQIAKQVAAAAEQAAAANHNHMFVLIVDDGGNLMYMERMDDAQLGSFEVALGKARSAVFFKRPTKMFEDAVTKNGYTPILKLPNAMPIEGGIPLIVDGHILGAIGVSGGTPQEDGKSAQAGADAFLGIIQAH